MWDSQIPEAQLAGESLLEEALAGQRGKAAPTGHHTELLGRNAPGFFCRVTEPWGLRSRQHPFPIPVPQSPHHVQAPRLGCGEGGCYGMELPES